MKIIITLFLLTAFASAQLTGEARLLKEKRVLTHMAREIAKKASDIGIPTSTISPQMPT